MAKYDITRKRICALLEKERKEVTQFRNGFRLFITVLKLSSLSDIECKYYSKVKQKRAETNSEAAAAETAAKPWSRIASNESRRRPSYDQSLRSTVSGTIQHSLSTSRLLLARAIQIAHLFICRRPQVSH